MMDVYKEEKQFDIRHYTRVILKRKWTIITVFLLVTLTAAFYTHRKASMTIPVYRASSRILIERESPDSAYLPNLLAIDSADRDHFQTQLIIIRSRAVAREVIQRLNLEDSPEFKPILKEDFFTDSQKWFGDILQLWKKKILSLIRTDRVKRKVVARKISESKSKETEAVLSKEDLRIDSPLVVPFMNRIDIDPIEGTRLVDVSFRAMDPVLAARTVNETVKAYIDLNMDSRLKATQDAILWLNERVHEEQKEVETAEIAMLLYKEKEGIIAGFSENTANITARNLADLNSQVVQAEAQRVEAETRYQQAVELEKDPEMIGSIQEVINNELIQEIRKKEITLYNRVSELSKKYGKNHPQMQAITSELADMEFQRENEIKRVINSIRNQYKLAVAKEESLKKAFAKLKKESLEMNKKAIKYRILQRKAESSKQLYDLLVKRFEETSLVEEIKTGNIRIVDKAVVPKAPINSSGSSRLRNFILLGLILGIGFAFFLEYLDNTIKMPDDVKSHLHIPYLGLVPAFTKNGEFDGIPPDLVTLHSPKSNASESFRGIRTNIIYSSADSPPQVILISSAGPTEGKTACASNIAVTMAQSGTKVVLLDCDMRRPRLHNVFNVQRNKGISSYLVGTSELKDVIFTTPFKNLDIIPCGPIPPNPSEILGSKKMRHLLEKLRKEYQRIVIDSPPIMAVTDSVVMAPLADGVLMVIRVGDTPRQVIQNGLSQLQTVNAHLLGAVLNGVEMGKDSYYYQYYYYYAEDGDQRKKSNRSKKSSSLIL